MFELIGFLFLICCGFALVVGLLKLFVVLLLIPLKIAWFMTKGLLFLVLGLPLLFVVGSILFGALPVIALLVLIPFILFAAVIGALAQLIF